MLAVHNPGRDFGPCLPFRIIFLIRFRVRNSDLAPWEAPASRGNKMGGDGRRGSGTVSADPSLARSRQRRTFDSVGGSQSCS